MMKNWTLFAFLLLLGACGGDPFPPLTVHLVGDSTMADKRDPEHNPERGWGQMLHLFFNDKVTVSNHAVNGRSSLSFINEGRWNEVMEEIRPGDYVFIQFGHNDQKAYDPERYTNPWSAYRRNLERMCREIMEREGNPVILSSIVRRNFNPEGTLEDTHGPYPYVAREVARELGIPFIDLQQQTEDLVSGLGRVRSTALYMHLKPGESEMYPEGRSDNTHLNVRGATEVAGMVAASVMKQGLPLSSYLAPFASLPRVLVVTGGHAYDTTAFVDLFRSMEQVRFDTLSQPHATGLLSSACVGQYNVLVFYDYVPEAPLKDTTVYTRLAFRGMPMLFLHHALCSFQGWNGFVDLAGGQYIMEGNRELDVRPSEYTHDLDIPVKVADRNHPVTRGMEDFTIHDEGYRYLQIAEGVTPLLSTDLPECDTPLGWVNHCGESTVVYLMLGHDRRAYASPSFRQLIRQSLLWLAETGNEP